MAEDCICTALTSIYTMQSDLFTQIVNRLNNINQTLNNIRYRLQTVDSVGLADEIHSLKIILNNVNTNLQYDNKGIAEIWSYKEMCVSNETIVESPLSTFVSKAKLDIDE